MSEVESKGFVYAVSTSDGAHVKFGWSQDPDKRLAEMQTGCPLELRIEATASWPRKYEHAIHVFAQQASVRGEWFMRGPVVEQVIDWMASGSKEGLEGCVGVGLQGKAGRRKDVLYMNFGALARIGGDAPTQVFFYLCASMGKGDVAALDVGEIAADIGLSVVHVRRVVKKLFERGYIERIGTTKQSVRINLDAWATSMMPGDHNKTLRPMSAHMLSARATQ